MKIGFVIDDHMGRPGGVQEYVRGLYRYLERHGHEAVIFSSGGGYPEDDLRLIAIGRALPFRGSGSSTSLPVTLAPSSRLRRLLEQESCDILHVMAPYSPTLASRLLKQSDAKHVMTFHVAVEPGLWRVALAALARTQFRSLRYFHGRIAVSPTAAETARAYYGGEYTIVPNGIDTTRFTSDTRERAADEESVTLLYVGRLERRKGVEYLVRAFARLEKQHPRLRLIIGGNGPERDNLEKLAGTLGLERISFLGYVAPQDLPRLLVSADIFCAPALRNESFGIVIIEAFAAGLPVVAAANPGYAALLAAHPGNVLVPPEDDEALAGALAALVDQPAYRRALGAWNRAAARQQYDWEAVGGAVLAFYQRLLSGEGSASAR